MRRHFVIVSAVIVALVTSGLSMAQGNPFVGTWKLNVAKSQYDPGPPPKSQTRMWESSGIVSIKGIDATGKPRTFGYTVKFDGKDYPTTGAMNGESVASTRIDANTMQAIFKKGGQQVEAVTFSVSKNGKRLTMVSKGTNAKGQSINNVEVWDKR